MVFCAPPLLGCMSSLRLAVACILSEIVCRPLLDESGVCVLCLLETLWALPVLNAAVVAAADCEDERNRACLAHEPCWAIVIERHDVKTVFIFPSELSHNRLQVLAGAAAA